jgi:hypothetical protein
MGRLPSNNRKYEIQSLQERHREILRMLALGQAPKDIASSLNITPQVVHYVKNSQVGKRELGLIQGARNADAIDITNQIQELAPEALDTLENLMNNEEESPGSLRAKIAIDILDRAGHGAVKKQLNVSHQLSEEDIDNIKIRSKELGRKNGIIVDAAFTTLTPSDTSKFIGTGTGNGQAITSSDTFPAGMTIYGQWTTITLASGSIIAYQGQY